MRTIPAALTAAAVAATALTTTAPAASAYAPLPCVQRVAHGYATETIGNRLLDFKMRTVAIHVAVGYKTCSGGGQRDSVRPQWWRMTTNVSGSSMPCAGGPDGSSPTSAPGLFRTVFSSYFSDAEGRNFHPAVRSLYCNSSTVSTTKQVGFKRSAKTLYFMPGNGWSEPQGRINYLVQVARAQDPSGTIRIRFARR